MIKNTKTGQKNFSLKNLNFIFSVEADFTSWHDRGRMAATGPRTKIMTDSNGVPYSNDGNIPWQHRLEGSTHA